MLLPFIFGIATFVLIYLFRRDFFVLTSKLLLYKVGASHVRVNLNRTYEKIEKIDFTVEITPEISLLLEVICRMPNEFWLDECYKIIFIQKGAGIYEHSLPSTFKSKILQVSVDPLYSELKQWSYGCHIAVSLLVTCFLASKNL